MRWDNLFDDLESQLEQGLNAEEVDLKAEEERLRLGRLSLRERLISLCDSYERRDDYAVRFALRSGETVRVRPATIGKDWLSGDIRDGSDLKRQCILPLSAVASMVLAKDQVRRSLTGAPRETDATLAARLGLPFVLRDLARRRTSIEAVALVGSAFGTIDRVGRDHFDVAVHEPGSPRRETSVSEYRLIPFAELVLVRL